MSFSADVLILVLYSVQQLGVVLGVGAQAIILVTYLVATRDRVIEVKEEQFANAVHKVLSFGLFLIVVSGVAITAIHYLAGEMAVVYSPAYLFKWILIGILVGAEVIRRKKAFPHFFWEGVVGANWFALFIIHILAPIALWIDLVVLYAIWSTGFVLFFTAAVYGTRAKPMAGKTPPAKVEKKIETIGKVTELPPMAELKKVLNVPPAMSQMVPPPKSAPAAPPPIAHTTPPLVPLKPKNMAPALPVPQKPMTLPQEKSAPANLPGAIDPHEIPGLPAIRVMPRTPEEANKHV